MQPTVRAIGPLIVALFGAPLTRTAAQVPITKGAEGVLIRLPAPRPVVARALADGKIEVTWGAVPGAESYTVYKLAPPAGLRMLSPTDPAETVYLDADVRPGTTYYYSVTAVDGDGAVSPKAAAAPVVATAPTGGGGATTPVTAPSLAAPAGLAAFSFPPPFVTLHWAYPTGDTDFLVERALVGPTTPTLNWQVRLRTGKLPCCLMMVMDRGDDLPETQRAVYRVSAVDPAAPGRNSAPAMSAEVNPGAGPQRSYGLAPGQFVLRPVPGYGRTLRVGQLGGNGFASTRPNRRIVSLDESIVSVNTTDGLYKARAPGVTYVFTMDIEPPSGVPWVTTDRVTVVP